LDSNLVGDAVKLLRQIANTKDPVATPEALLTLGTLYIDLSQDQVQNQGIARTQDHGQATGVNANNTENYKNALVYLKQLEPYSIYWDAAKYFIGKIYEQQHDFGKAIEWYTQVNSGKYNVNAAIRAAMLLAIDNNFTAAIDVLDNSQPNSLTEQKKVILTRIELLVEANQYSEALMDVNAALNALPDDIDLLYARSLVASYLDNVKLAEQDLNQILAINPNNANALNALGYTLARMPDRHKDAMSYLTKALKISPNNPNYMDSMGWLLLQMGKIDEAVAILDKAYSLNPDDNIVIHFSQALWASGNREKALSILSKAITKSPNNKSLQDTLQGLRQGDGKDEKPTQ
jgi:tetratricopeptide (TPR) repeat protein